MKNARTNICPIYDRVQFAIKVINKSNKHINYNKPRKRGKQGQQEVLHRKLHDDADYRVVFVEQVFVCAPCALVQ